MESLSAYASDEEVYSNTKDSTAGHSAKHHPSRREDDTNYDHVTMDMSEESNNNNSDYDSPREFNRRSSQSSGERDRYNAGSSPKEQRSKGEGFSKNERKRSSERRLEASSSGSKSRGERGDSGNRSKQILKRDNGQQSISGGDDRKQIDDKVADLARREHSDRREKDDSDKKERDGSDQRDKDVDRDRRYNSHNKDNYDKRSHGDRKRYRSRSRDKNGHRRRSPSMERDKLKRGYDNRHSEGSKFSNSRDGRRFKKSRSKSPIAANSEYKPSYKVSKKLQAMDKMGLQIKTPDGSMATARMLMKRTLAEQAEKAKSATGAEPSEGYNPAMANLPKYADRIQKRKLLWGGKAKESAGAESRAAEAGAAVAGASSAPASKWLETKFAQDSDGKVASKFMRLMGIKNAEVPKEAREGGDQAKKREEMFEAMQAQYEVARATTHSLRGVGLGFSARSKPF